MGKNYELEELKEVLLKFDKPSVYFEDMKDRGALLPRYEELECLIGLEQDPIYHPEGDVWTHTMEVINRGALKRNRSSDPFRFMLFCLTHDLGKSVTTSYAKGRIHAYGHEKESPLLAKRLLDRLGADRETIEYLENMVPLHMKANTVVRERSGIKSSNKLFDMAQEPYDLVLFAECDKIPETGEGSVEKELEGRYRTFSEIMARPCIKEEDLEKAGIAKGKTMDMALEYAHKLRLAGIEKETALKQTISWARSQWKK